MAELTWTQATSGRIYSEIHHAKHPGSNINVIGLGLRISDGKWVAFIRDAMSTDILEGVSTLEEAKALSVVLYRMGE